LAGRKPRQTDTETDRGTDTHTDTHKHTHTHKDRQTEREKGQGRERGDAAAAEEEVAVLGESIVACHFGCLDCICFLSSSVAAVSDQNCGSGKVVLEQARSKWRRRKKIRIIQFSVRRKVLAG
jgi:hypothetical protein